MRIGQEKLFNYHRIFLYHSNLLGSRYRSSRRYLSCCIGRGIVEPNSVLWKSNRVGSYQSKYHVLTIHVPKSLLKNHCNLAKTDLVVQLSRIFHCNTDFITQLNSIFTFTFFDFDFTFTLSISTSTFHMLIFPIIKYCWSRSNFTWFRF